MPILRGDDELPDEVQSALRKAWSLSTARQWTPNNPAVGQCNVTSRQCLLAAL